jgi:hypothetical protein
MKVNAGLAEILRRYNNKFWYMVDGKSYRPYTINLLPFTILRYTNKTYSLSTASISSSLKGLEI